MFRGYPSPVPYGPNTGPDPWTPGQRRAEGYSAVQRHDEPGWTIIAPDGRRYRHAGVLTAERAIELSSLEHTSK